MNWIRIENFFTDMAFLSLVGSNGIFWFRRVLETQFQLVLQKDFLSILKKSCLVCITLVILTRWGNSNHYPVSNLYESLWFLSWSVIMIGILLEKNSKLDLLDPIVLTLGLIFNVFAVFYLPQEMKTGASLVPALKSNWLLMHVSIILSSYAALMTGSLVSIFYLIIKKSNIKDRSNFEFQLENLSYKLIGLGFPLLTLGILSGAVWANEAWGSYWSWDPKETWSLITWLVYAIYLHTRLVKRWEGEKPAWISSFGFVVVWICYLGVNLLGKGLHSYGWWS